MEMEALRTCRQCGTKAYTRDDLEDFKKDKGSKHGRSTICRECDRTNKKQEYRDLPEEKTREVIAQRSIRKNGIDMTVEEFLTAKDEAANCAICNIVLDTDTHKHMDHDHDTRKPREVLCTNCNIALGHVKDNTTILSNMIHYLYKHKEI